MANLSIVDDSFAQDEEELIQKLAEMQTHEADENIVYCDAHPEIIVPALEAGHIIAAIIRPQNREEFNALAQEISSEDYEKIGVSALYNFEHNGFSLEDFHGDVAEEIWRNMPLVESQMFRAAQFIKASHSFAKYQTQCEENEVPPKVSAQISGFTPGIKDTRNEPYFTTGDLNAYIHLAGAPLEFINSNRLTEEHLYLIDKQEDFLNKHGRRVNFAELSHSLNVQSGDMVISELKMFKRSSKDANTYGELHINAWM